MIVGGIKKISNRIVERCQFWFIALIWRFARILVFCKCHVVIFWGARRHRASIWCLPIILSECNLHILIGTAAQASLKHRSINHVSVWAEFLVLRRRRFEVLLIASWRQVHPLLIDDQPLFLVVGLRSRVHLLSFGPRVLTAIDLIYWLYCLSGCVVEYWKMVGGCIESFEGALHIVWITSLAPWTDGKFVVLSMPRLCAHETALRRVQLLIGDTELLYGHVVS